MNKTNLEFSGKLLSDNGGEQAAASFQITVDNSHRCFAYAECPNECSISIGTTGSIESQDVCSEHIQVKDIEDRPNSRRRFDLVLYDLVKENRSLLDSIGELPFGSETAIRREWSLSGIAWAPEEGPEESCIKLSEGIWSDNEAILRLEKSKSREIDRVTGRIIDHIIYIPVYQVTYPAHDRTLVAVEEEIDSHKDRVAFISCILSWLSSTSVGWLGFTQDRLHPKGDPQFMRATYRFARSGIWDYSDDLSRKHVIQRQQIINGASAVKQWGKGLISAIDFYVGALHQKGQERFISLTTGLEAVKQAFIDREGHGSLVSEKKFSSWIPEFENFAQKTLLEDEDAEELLPRIKAKVNEINRAEYAFLVNRMCEFLKVDYEELYPREFSFIKIRNELFHRGIIPSSKDLDTESARLSKLLKQIIKAMIKASQS